MTSAPRVSVLLPAFNAAATLGACLRSLTRQRETRWECVLVDDGSTDATPHIVAAAAAADARVQVVRRPHRGLVAALSAGLPLCRAPYVARMDADDIMHRDRLGAQVELLDRHPHLAAVGCHVRLWPRTGLTDGRRAYERWLLSIRDAGAVRAEAFVECPVAHPTLLVRRDVLRLFGYRDAGWPEDYDLVLRLLAAGHEIGMVPRRLVSWRDHPGRLSRLDSTYSLDRFTACKAEFLAMGFLQGHARYVLWGYGSTGKALARALAEHGKQPSAIVDVHPRRMGQRIGGVPVVPPDALAGLRPPRLVVSVAGPGPRALIRDALATMGFVELRDFVCAA
ncbi:MAG: glycosyltransferase [Acidobacteria bacterium]|nr:glycosyltransferase [Acidobacteriota bacterium]